MSLSSRGLGCLVLSQETRVRLPRGTHEDLLPEPVGWALSLRRKDVRVRVSPRALCPRNLMDRNLVFETMGVSSTLTGGTMPAISGERAVLIRLSARVRRPSAGTTRGWSSGWASVLHADEEGSIPSPRTDACRTFIGLLFSINVEETMNVGFSRRSATPLSRKAPGVRTLPSSSRWRNGQTGRQRSAKS